MNSDIQYRSSVELAKKYKIKREELAKEYNDKTRKEQATMAHKRKNPEGSIPQQGKSKFYGHKSMIQSNLREDINTSQMIAGKGSNTQRLFQSQFGESIKKKGMELPMHNFMLQSSSKVDVNTSHIIGKYKVNKRNNMLFKSYKTSNR